MLAIFPMILLDRFTGTRPNYTLSDFNGTMMIERLIDPVINDYDIVVILLRAYESEFPISSFLKEKYGNKIQIDIIETEPNTIEEAVTDAIKLHHFPTHLPLLIKDCSSIVNDIPKYECTLVSESGKLLGLTKFKTISLFLDGHIPDNVVNSNNIDCSTLDSWVAHNNKSVIFCDIDGTIIKAQPKDKYNENPTPLVENIARIQKEVKNGSQLIFTTARSKIHDERTTEMLKSLGFNNFRLVSNLINGKRIVINDFTASTPYPRALAMNIKRDTDTLGEL